MSSMAKVVDRNIRPLLEHRQEQQVGRSRQERIADAVTGFTGSMRFVKRAGLDRQISLLPSTR